MIQHTQLFFKHPLNVSVQVGDFAYFARTGNAPQSLTHPGTQFQINNNDMHEIGEIIHIFSNPTTFPLASNNSIVCKFNCNHPAGDCLNHLPAIDDFIMFSKDNVANMTSILGYYAEVEMVNDSTDKAKLFAVSADIIESSK